MYTIIFTVLPYEDSDNHSLSTQGEMSLYSYELKSDVNKCLKEIINTHLIHENMGYVLNTNTYGEWGIVILKDGVVLQEFNMYCIGFNDFTDSIDCDEFPINTITYKECENIKKLTNLTRNFKNKESEFKKGMAKVYLAIQKEKDERAQLKSLLEKYPDMKES